MTISWVHLFERAWVACTVDSFWANVTEDRRSLRRLISNVKPESKSVSRVVVNQPCDAMASGHFSECRHAWIEPPLLNLFALGDRREVSSTAGGGQATDVVIVAIVGETTPATGFEVEPHGSMAVAHARVRRLFQLIVRLGRKVPAQTCVPRGIQALISKKKD